MSAPSRNLRITTSLMSGLIFVQVHGLAPRLSTFTPVSAGAAATDSPLPADELAGAGTAAVSAHCCRAGAAPDKGRRPGGFICFYHKLIRLRAISRVVTTESLTNVSGCFDYSTGEKLTLDIT